jgi:hypothetical protein
MAIQGMSRSPELFTHFLEANMARVRPWRMPVGGVARFLWGLVLPRKAPLAGLLPWFALGFLALGMRLWMHWALDLRDIPGPAAAISLVRAWMEPTQIQWDVRLISALNTVLGDIELAGWTASMLGSLAEVAGAALLGWALLGRGGGLGAGLIAAIWSLCIHDALIGGANPVATGLAWFGTGLCVAGVCAGRRSWFMVVLGAFIALLGADTKVVVLPVLPLLGAVLLARSPSRRAQIASVSLAVLTAWVCWEFLQPESSQQLVGGARFGPASIPEGWVGIREMVTRGHPEGHIELIIGGAFLGGLLPGPRWTARLLMLALSMVLVLATAAMLGPIIKPRYLLPPSLGLVVMAGLSLPLLAHHIQRIRPRALSLVAFLPLWLLLDGIAFMEGQAQRRMDYVGADSPSLPPVPAAFMARYADIPDPMLLGLTARGMVDLRKLLSERTGGGATLMLRDNRHTQAELMAYLEGRPFRVLDDRSCCEGRVRERCALEVVQELDDAGMALFLPLQSSHRRRVKPDDDLWLEDLYLAARELHQEADIETRWWWVREARGSGGEPPCLAGPSAIGGDMNRRAGDRGG